VQAGRCHLLARSNFFPSSTSSVPSHASRSWAVGHFPHRRCGGGYLPPAHQRVELRVTFVGVLQLLRDRFGLGVFFELMIGHLLAVG